jgi:hypothetical protein
VGSSRAAHGRSDRVNVRGGGRLLPYGANSFVRSIDDLSKPLGGATAGTDPASGGLFVIK